MPGGNPHAWGRARRSPAGALLWPGSAWETAPGLGEGPGGCGGLLGGCAGKGSSSPSSSGRAGGFGLLALRRRPYGGRQGRAEPGEPPRGWGCSGEVRTPAVVPGPRGCAVQQDLGRSGWCCWKFPPGSLVALGEPPLRGTPRSARSHPSKPLPPPPGRSFPRVPAHPRQRGQPASLYFSCFSSSSSLKAAKAPGNFPPALGKEQTNSGAGKWL